MDAAVTKLVTLILGIVAFVGIWYYVNAQFDKVKKEILDPSKTNLGMPVFTSRIPDLTKEKPIILNPPININKDSTRENKPLPGKK
jgi:hypothetical protein